MRVLHCRPDSSAWGLSSEPSPADILVLLRRVPTRLPSATPPAECGSEQCALDPEMEEALVLRWGGVFCGGCGGCM